jgi:hypothetical protein
VSLGYYDQSYPPSLFAPPPVVVPATGATAGTPGTFTPAGSTTPATGGDVASLTAEPQTAWTTGQWVQAANGDQRWWNGVAWVVGKAL